MMRIELTGGYCATVDDGDFAWLSQWKWFAKKEKRTGLVYACRSQHAPRKTIRMHRLILGDPPGIQIDHRDLDTLNNQRENLRRATHAQNTTNRSVQKNNSIGLKGVSPRDQKFIARIQSDGKSVHLGRFDTRADAANAYAKAAAALHGEFSRTGRLADAAGNS